MLKNLSQLEHKIGDKIYNFFCDINSPLHEVKDALIHFMTFIGNLEATNTANQSAQNSAPASQSAVIEDQPKVPENTVEPQG